MIKHATGDCYWSFDTRDDYRLTLMVRQFGGVEKALLSFRTFERDKFLSIAVLLGERQHLWGDWRALAERVGPEALDHVLDAAMPNGPLPNVADLTIASHPSKTRTVTVSVHLLPTRKVDLIRHTFQKTQMHSAFMDWATEASLGRRIDLGLVGLLQGKQALAAKMDEFAKLELDFGLAVKDAMLTALAEGRDEAFIPPMSRPRR